MPRGREADMAPNRKNPPPTLCWKCARATAAPGLACSWSRHDDFCPVEGWEAVPSYNDNNSPENRCSYTVFACPLFMAEPEREVLPFYEYDEEPELPRRSWGREPGSAEREVKERC